MARVISDNNNLFGWQKEKQHDSVLILTEPYLLHPENYIEAAAGEWKAVLSHHKRFVERYDNWYYYPLGGTFVPPESRSCLVNKRLTASMFISEKDTMPGHKLRHKFYRPFKDVVDIYGRGFNPVENKADGLSDYYFSIVIESCRERGYFTEKIIDCFLTGTIPIYWGDPDIGEVFDDSAIIEMPENPTVEDLNYLLVTLGRSRTEVMEKMYHGLRKNYKLASQYLDHKEWINEHYKAIIND